MGTRIPPHQLSNGLYVSGRPDQHKERQPTTGSRAVPYTEGDVKKSGELGKTLDIAVVDPSAGGPPPLKPSRHSSSSQHTSGSVRSGPNSGQLPKLSNSGPIHKKSSGPMPLQPAGLITSGPPGSSGSVGGRHSGQLEPSGSMGKTVYSSSVMSLNEEAKFGFKVSKTVMWVFLVVADLDLPMMEMGFRLAHGWRFEPKPKFVMEMAVLGLAHGSDLGLGLEPSPRVDEEPHCS